MMAIPLVLPRVKTGFIKTNFYCIGFIALKRYMSNCYGAQRNPRISSLLCCNKCFEFYLRIYQTNIKEVKEVRSVDSCFRMKSTNKQKNNYVLPRHRNREDRHTWKILPCWHIPLNRKCRQLRHIHPHLNTQIYKVKKSYGWMKRNELKQHSVKREIWMLFNLTTNMTWIRLRNTL